MKRWIEIARPGVWPCLLLLVVARAFQAGIVDAQQPPHELGIKYMRDSEEYATLTRQIYRLAGEAAVKASAAGGRWAVVLDIDETTLDNSTYQLERAAYSGPHEEESWRAWVRRREAAAVPGVREFVDVVRGRGGHVGWITNRDTVLADATRANLASLGLWNDDDRLCLQKNSRDTKAQRRQELIAGQGECSWPSSPTRVVVFVGDQMGDFPAAEENIADTGTDAAFGHTCFLLPNSMYGNWTSRVTRK